MSSEPVMEITDLKKYFDQQSNFTDLLFRRESDPIKAVDGVSFQLQENETIGVIGESGCGKSTLLKTIMGLHTPTDGEVTLHGNSTAEFGKSDWKQYRRDVQIIFQDPFNSMDPKYTVRATLREPLRIHGIGDREDRIHEMLEMVELNPPENYLEKYPHELSGGEKQRVSIARALILEPDIILADEPVSMLDVSTQSAILNLLARLIDETNVSMIYISHDLSTVSYVCDRISVMYLGRVVEKAPTLQLLNEPKHPYSQALINAVPIPDPDHDRERTRINSPPADLTELGEGCRYKDRCPERMDVCDIKPDSVPVDGREVACHLYYEHETNESNVPEGKVQ